MSLTLKLALAPVLVAQGLITRARTPRLPEAEGARSGAVGRGAPLRLLVAGDSSAAGVGVRHQRDALAQPLATALAGLVARRVHWQLLARTGLDTAQTLDWLRGEAALAADLAVIVTGVNDITSQVASTRAVAAREALANRLRNAVGVRHVVFTPVPPMQAFPALPQPLRWMAGADAARHNRALREWAATRRDVSCVELQLCAAGEAVAADGFHPGADTYRRSAEGLARHLAEFA